MNSAHLLRTAPPAGHLWVLCWCERGVVAVPVDRIGHETGYCGRGVCVERRAA